LVLQNISFLSDYFSFTLFGFLSPFILSKCSIHFRL
jgi:hypothetical protein